jgi:hypothetical protein
MVPIFNPTNPLLIKSEKIPLDEKEKLHLPNPKVKKIKAIKKLNSDYIIN